METKVNCLKCKYFKSTFDVNAPYGCSLYNLKSKIIPNTLVKRETGSDCFSFEERKKRVNKDELDLNSDDLW